MRRLRGLLALGLLGVLVPSAARAEDEAALPEDVQALFAWWDGLGYPDIREAPLVRVAEARWQRYGDEEPEPIYDHAFLLSDEPKVFRVFTTDLRLKVLEKSPPGVKEVDRVGFDAVDLASFVRAGLERMREPFERPRWAYGPDPFGLHRWASPNHAFRALVLARACAARGLDDLARQLLDLALAEHWPHPDEPPADRFAPLRRSLAHEAYAVLLERVPEPACSHAELADLCRRFAERFPDHPQAGDVMRAAGVYASWPRAAPLPDGEAAAEQIERAIREVQRRPTALFAWGTPEEESAPERARLLAFEAVPRLLLIVTSNDPTRTLVTYFSGKGQYRDWQEASTLGDVVRRILQEIAAGALEEEFTAGRQSRAERAERFRIKAEAWWAEVQSRGEASVLAEEVGRGGEGAAPAARRLLSLDLGRGIACVLDAVRSATKPYPVTDLVVALGEREEPTATHALLQILEQKELGPRLRLEAARALHARGHEAAVPAMVKEWRRPSAQPVQEDVGLPADPGFTNDLLSFLADSRDARAYAALARDLDGMPTYWRFQVTAAFLALDRAPADPAHPEADLDKGAQRALEDLLAGRLEDEGEVDGVYMSVGGTSVDTRIKHVAARALWVQLPSRYAYDPRASSRVRERMRRAALDRYREARGLAPLPPLVEKPLPLPVPAEQVQAALGRIFAAESEALRRGATEELEALGVGAVPPLLDALEREGDAARKEALARLASRQASIVTDITFTTDSAKPAPSTTALLETIRGRPFDGAFYVALMLHITRTMPAGTSGLRVRASRLDDLTGVTLEVTLIEHRLDDGFNRGGWGYGTPGGGGGFAALEYGQRAEAWEDDAKDVDAALNAPAKREVTLRFSVVRLVD